MGFPGGTSGKESTCQRGRCWRCWFNPWVRKIPWRRTWQSTSVFLPGESRGQRSLAGYSPWGRKESHMTEVIHDLVRTHLVDKTQTGFKSATLILKEVLLWIKCYQTAFHATEKSFLKRRANQWGKLHCCLILRNHHSLSNLRQHHPYQHPSTSR